MVLIDLYGTPLLDIEIERNKGVQFIWLVADGQASSVALSIGKVQPGSDGCIQVVNENDYAVDVSKWRVTAGNASYLFVPGTVIPPKDSVYIAASSVAAFKRANSGKGLFCVGPLVGFLDNGSVDVKISRQ